MNIAGRTAAPAQPSRQHRPLALERRHAVGRLHQRDEAADEERNHRIEQRQHQARDEHRPYQRFACLMKYQ